MSRCRSAAIAVVLTAAIAGCGLGPGESSEGEAHLTVTRDYGARPVAEVSEENPPASETALRMLDRETDITTRYGGGFVQSIDGVAGGVSGGRSYDWFFYVNGIESPTGAAEVDVRGGDRVWWDYRDWTAAMSVPAVVGSWPEPFAQESAGGNPDPVSVECAGSAAPCDLLADRLAEQGVDAATETLGSEHPRPETVRVLVGPWARVRDDPVARRLERGPETSGVFARPRRRAHGWRFELLDVRGRPSVTGGRGSGLIAATRSGDAAPVWMVTGIDPAGVSAAAELVDDGSLRNRYAVGAVNGEAVPVPVAEHGAGGGG